ncbi:MAG TPA: sigma-54 dependent transcriptional regulator, partial [Bacteroidales bacterium]|nr:sigma-54 dependent transcriptional regulator [Bacteroidales bacterium]
MSSILIIDDEQPIRKTLREILEYEKFKVSEAENGIKALELIKANKFDVVLCDIKMPQMDGLEVLDKIQELSDVPVVMISGHGNIDTAVEAIKRGAFDYISKPPDLNRLLVTVRNALDRHSLVTETRKLKQKISKAYEIVGESAAIMQIKEMIERVAPTDARVLITGENGTGKELVARWLHELSARAGNSFIEVNCAAIPSELIESQLFGHEKGSFTSAIKQRKGDFELASGGTLFLDEIGDMSLSAQAKVLRVLQENIISRVGGDKHIKVDVRVVSATNADLSTMVKDKSFREDLFYRINLIQLHVPALRERKEDIPLLSTHFAKLQTLQNGLPAVKFTSEALNFLKSLPFPGNIRELKNLIDRTILVSGKAIIDAQ